MRESLKIFKSLCDETRLKLAFSFPKSGCFKVQDAHPWRKSQPGSNKWTVPKLEDLGVVESRSEGRNVYYRLTNEKVKEILKIVKMDWTMIQIIQKIKISEVSLC